MGRSRSYTAYDDVDDVQHSPCLRDVERGGGIGAGRPRRRRSRSPPLLPKAPTDAHSFTSATTGSAAAATSTTTNPKRQCCDKDDNVMDPLLVSLEPPRSPSSQLLWQAQALLDATSSSSSSLLSHTNRIALTTTTTPTESGMAPSNATTFESVGVVGFECGAFASSATAWRTVGTENGGAQHPEEEEQEPVWETTSNNKCLVVDATEDLSGGTAKGLNSEPDECTHSKRNIDVSSSQHPCRRFSTEEKENTKTVAPVSLSSSSMVATAAVRLPLAPSLEAYWQPGAPARMRPRPEWFGGACGGLDDDDAAAANQQEAEVCDRDPGKPITTNKRQHCPKNEPTPTTMPCSNTATRKIAVVGKDSESALHMAIRDKATEAALALLQAAAAAAKSTAMMMMEATPAVAIALEDSTTTTTTTMLLLPLWESTNAKGVTPLILAAQKGNARVVDALLELGVDPAASSIHGTTAVLQAAHFGHADVLKIILRAARSKAEAQSPTTTMTNGSVNGNFPSYLDGGISAMIEAGNRHQTTPLMRAAQEGHCEAVRVLLAAGATVNLRNRYRLTALLLAAQRGHVATCKQLIQAGADMNAVTDDQRSTALMLACKRGHANVVQALVTAGCNVSYMDRKGRTAQQIIARQHAQYQREGMEPTTFTAEKVEILMHLVDPETQVQLMQKKSRHQRNWEIIRMWSLLQLGRARVCGVSGNNAVDIHTVEQWYYDQAGCDTHLSSASFNPNRYYKSSMSSTHALIRTMTLPAPLVQTIAEFLPMSNLWTRRLSMLQTTSHGNADAGVAGTLDFIDEVLEEAGFLEICDQRRIPAPIPFHNWYEYKRSCVHATTRRSLAATLAVGVAPSVTESTMSNPRSKSQMTRVELRRQAGYMTLLARNVLKLGRDGLVCAPYFMPVQWIQQLARIADLASLSRRMDGRGVHFDAGVATDIMVLARRLSQWQSDRHREDEHPLHHTRSHVVQTRSL